ncbi:phage major capsid protein [Mycolicibacterium fortuitum]|uniref:phage major capsid protein n=1 Tax=Mycolicibacterium fortuitum TaxID=1766 RepID=UPI0009D78421|nr:phage major capsid protein [Mycolicibacterium fortuitum]
MSDDTNTLPRHPVTGLRALGFTSRGPVWPVAGAAPDDAGPTLTYSQARNRADEIHARMEQIAELDNPTDEENDEFRSLGEEFDGLVTHMNRLERSAEMARVGAMRSRIGQPSPSGSQGTSRRMGVASGSQGSRDEYDRDAILEPDSIEDCRFRDPWDLSEVRTWGRDAEDVSAELRSRALAAIAKMPGASDTIRQAATNIIEEFDSKDARLARFALATSRPAYLRAWSKLATGKGHALSDVEQRAINDVEQFRAMSLTDNKGGYLVPFQLDPTVIVTSSGVRSDIRQAARQVVATGDVWHGVSSQNVSWSFDDEAEEVSDDAPDFGQPSIPNYMARGFVPISIEAMMDEQNVAQEVGRLLAGGKQDLEATKLTLGSGTKEPTGLITALAAASGISVDTATAATFALADVYALQGALPARFRAAASWLANNLTYNKIRQFDTAGGGGFWANLTSDRPPQLLNRDALESEAMTSATTTGSKLAVFGDFENFVITDRLGMAVEFIPHLVGTNRRPTGQRGWFAYYRVGSDVVNPNGFRYLNVK